MNRRHDLDALRAFAMLLGLALHAALSFGDAPWVVQDRFRHPAFGIFTAAVHGFRMPVFFLMSGFFTAMLWRNRGLAGLLKQRVLRIVIPLAIGCGTIVPLVWVVIIGANAMARAAVAGVEKSEQEIWSASAYGNLAAVRRLVEEGADLNREEPSFGQSPLAWAVIGKQTGAVELLLELGADPNARYRDENTALHTAAFFGRADCAELLLDAGADVAAKNTRRETPLDALAHDRDTTEFIAKLMTVPINFDEVAAGRERTVPMLLARGATPSSARKDQDDRPGQWFSALIEGLIAFPAFHHLWFLWFLCWLVAIFAFVVALPLPALPKRVVRSPVLWLFVIALTLLPQAAMHDGGANAEFGPDTSIGILPMPHVLFYYAIFFAFGALLFEAGDDAPKPGRTYWIQLPVALLVVLPLSHAFSFQAGWSLELAGDNHHGISVLLEVLYTWLMVFGLMGLFSRFLSGEHPRIRYLSDAAYLLYLIHLPLVIAGQALVRTWPLPAVVKFALVLGVVTGSLLLIYQVAVRYTPVGTLLNGKRVPPSRRPPPLPD